MIIIMDLPIFDITNIPKKYLCVKHNTYAYTRNKHILYKSIENQINHLLKINNIEITKYTENIHFVKLDCDSNHINNYYKQYYTGNYKPIKCDIENAYLVMQKDAPLQIFIPEDKYTFLNEYVNVDMTLCDVEKLHNKVRNFSMYHNEHSVLTKALVKRIFGIKRLYYVYWSFKDMFVMDFVNEVISMMHNLMKKLYLDEYNYMVSHYDNKFNGVVYGKKL